MNDESDYKVWTELQSHEPELTIIQRFALVEIAHQTADSDVRKWAINTLERASVIPVMVKAS